MPPVVHIDVDADSAVDTKGAFVEGIDHLAVKIATGFFRNPQIGLPGCSSIIAPMDAKTGAFDCVFLDNGYLMDLRTGLAGAVATKHLAPKVLKPPGLLRQACKRAIKSKAWRSCEISSDYWFLGLILSRFRIIAQICPDSLGFL